MEVPALQSKTVGERPVPASAGIGDQLFAEAIPELTRRLRDLGVEDAETRQVVGEYRLLVRSVVAVDATVAETSDEIIRGTSSRLPVVDALIAASARVMGARLVHRDSHMRAIPAASLDQLDLDSE